MAVNKIGGQTWDKKSFEMGNVFIDALFVDGYGFNSNAHQATGMT